MNNNTKIVKLSASLSIYSYATKLEISLRCCGLIRLFKRNTSFTESNNKIYNSKLLFVMDLTNDSIYGQKMERNDWKFSL